ncbi:MAG: ParB/RepB/Spo0J family partition protein [Pseudomonadota bacterium]
MAVAAKGLGRGLSSLMGEGAAINETMSAPDAVKPTATLPIALLRAGKYQPRRHFDEAALAELSDSIEKHGLMQPIVVRLIAHNQYEIIAGERRFRAATLAKLVEVPVIIREVSDSEALELALIENIQRADLNPLEEAAGYQRLMNEFGYTQEKLAPVVGKSRSHVANLLRLLKLPESVKKRIDTGELTMGHARAILMSPNPEELARQITEIGLSVRQAEEMAKGMQPDTQIKAPAVEKKPSGNARQPDANKSEDVLQLENMLADSLGLRVSIDTRGGQAGDVVISYDSLSQLDEILRRLGGGV